MVFGVQKGGFYIAKVWFLHCQKLTLVEQTQNKRNTKITYFVEYSLHNAKPLAGVGVRFIVPVSTNTHQMALRFSTIGIAIRNISYIKTDKKKREVNP